jgi:membrane protein required for colicin V production
LTGFDILAGAILLVSGLVGFVRGATREVVTVTAFIVAVAVSILALRITGPLAAHFIHIHWLARTAALIGGFLAVYVAVRLAGGVLSRGVRQSVLSGPDRLLGAAIGLARGVVVVGVVVLAIRAATPPERLPGWYTHATVYPVANAAGGALQALAPQGMSLIRRAAPEVESAMNADDGETQPKGYSDAERGALNVLVEKSRR